MCIYISYQHGIMFPVAAERLKVCHVINYMFVYYLITITK